MSDRIRIAELRAAWEWSVSANPGEWDGLSGMVTVSRDELLALVEAVESANAVYEADEHGVFPAEGPDELAAWHLLGRSLDRFDFEAGA